jgi:hypothetical protein
MDRTRILLLMVLGLACSRAEPERAEPAATAEPSEPTSPSEPELPQPTAWKEPFRGMLLVHQHLPDQASAKVAGIEISDPSGPMIGSGRTHSASVRSDWPGHFSSELSHAGGMDYVVVQGEPEQWRLEVWSLAPGDEPFARVEIGSVLPSAVMLIRDNIFLGQANTIGWIDMSAEPMVRVELTRREELFGKAYDLFVRSGDWVIAIDDQVTPIWADGFRLGPGQPERIQDLALPSAINGSYYAGELVASGPTDGVMYLLLHYGIMDGHGHDLTALTIRDGKLTVASDVVINSSDGVNPPVVEEHVDRGTNKPVELVAGTDYTEWSQIAYVPGAPPRLLISAGARGLFELPIDFGPRSKAHVIDLGGSVVDVMWLRERVYALVNTGEPAVASELVELTLQPVGGVVERRTGLPDVYHRFVR